MDQSGRMGISGLYLYSCFWRGPGVVEGVEVGILHWCLHLDSLRRDTWIVEESCVKVWSISEKGRPRSLVY